MYNPIIPGASVQVPAAAGQQGLRHQPELEDAEEEAEPGHDEVQHVQLAAGDPHHAPRPRLRQRVLHPGLYTLEFLKVDTDTFRGFGTLIIL